MCSLIGIDYARKNGPAWADRIPLVGFEKIDTGSREGKVYQAILLGALSLLPVLSIIHFWHLFWRADVVTTENSSRGGPEHLELVCA